MFETILSNAEMNLKVRMITYLPPFDRLDCTSHKAMGIGSRLDDSDSSGSRKYRKVGCSHFYVKGNKYVERAKTVLTCAIPYAII